MKTAVSFSIPSLTNAVASISFIRLPLFPFNCNFLELESYAIDNVADKPLGSCESTLSSLFIFKLTVLLLLVSALDTVTAFSPTYCVNAALATLREPLSSFFTMVLPSMFTSRLTPPPSALVTETVFVGDATAAL